MAHSGFGCSSLRSLFCAILASLIIFVLAVATAPAQEKVAPINRYGLRLWYEKQGLPVPDYARPGAPPKTPAGPTISSSDGPDIRPFPSTNPQSENSIAVGVGNPDMLFLATNGAPVSTGTTWFFSTNGGAAWFGSETSPNSVANSGDPIALFDAAGNAYWVALSSSLDNIKVARTTNLGTTWTITNADPIGGFDDKDHAMADLSGVYPNNVYAAWTDFNFSPARVILTRSTDNGATWGARAQFSIGADFGHGTNIAVGPNGEVYLVFANYTGGVLPETGMRFAKSTDGGASWSAAVLAFSMSGIRMTNGPLADFNNTRVNSFPSMGVDRSSGSRRGWIYVTYADRSTGDADIYLRRSSDGGDSWSGAIRVNGETAGNGKQQWFPSIAVDPTNGDLSVSYYSMDSTGYLTARYIAHSIDGGTTWDRIRVSDVRFTPASFPSPFAAGYMGDYYETAAYGGHAWATWGDDRSGKFQAYVSKVTYTENFGWVRGSITTGGSPLGGVMVDFADSVEQQTGTSGPGGAYVAGAKVDTSVLTALMTLRARKFGYSDLVETLTVVRNDTVTRDLALVPAPGGTLAGRVFGVDSAGVRANVQVRFNGTLVVSDLYSDSATGAFAYPLPNGTYDITVDAPSPYVTRQFPSLVVNGDTALVNALVRYAVEPSPAALADTLGAEQSNTVNLSLTNTTGVPIPFHISSDEAALPLVPAPQKLFDDLSPSKDPDLVLAKGALDPRIGPPVMLGKGGPDSFGYLWIDSDEPGGPAYNFVDIRSIGTQVPNTGSGSWIPSSGFDPRDEGYVGVHLPFSFGYYGSIYDSVYFSTNGYLSTQRVTVSSYSIPPIPSTTLPNGVIAAFWDDFDLTNGGHVYYYHDAVNQRFIVQYDSIGRYGGGPGHYSYEYILGLDGHITFQYSDMTQGGGTLTGAVIGVENASGTVGLQVAYHTAYVHNGLAVLVKLRGVSWLSHAPSAGTIPAGETTVIVNTFDATGLVPHTTYAANVLLEPLHPDVAGGIIIPAHLAVKPVSGPGIYVRPLVASFGNVVIFGTKTDTLRLKNIGDSTLIVSELSSAGAEFTVTPASVTLPSGDSTKIFVTFAPVDSGPSSASIRLVSNDPLNDTVNISVTGTGVPVPHFAARVDSLTQALDAGALDTVRFFVRNDGTGSGQFSTRAVMYPSAFQPGAAQAPLLIPLHRGTIATAPAQEAAAAQHSGRTSSSLPAARSVWGADAIKGQAGASATTHSPVSSVSAFTLPVIVSDSVGDGGSVDVKEIRGQIDNGAVTLQVVFQTPLNPSNFGGYLGLDTDQNGATGVPMPFSLAAQDVGCEYYLTLFSLSSGQVLLYNAAGAPLGNIPATVASDNFSFSIPLSTLGGDDGAMNLAAVVGTSSGPTDWIPDAGHGTVTPLVWLTIQPRTGAVGIGDSILMVAGFNATATDFYENPGDYFGRIDMEPTNSAYAESLGIPVRMTVSPPPGPRLIVNHKAVGFDTVVVNTSLQRSVRVKNVGLSPLVVTGLSLAKTQYSASPTSFTLATSETALVTITFTPTSEGPLVDTLRFISNDPASYSVALSGTGLGVPHFAVRTDSLVTSVESGGRDSLQFYLRNDGTRVGEFIARAIMYPQAGAAGSSARAIALPVTIKPAKQAQPGALPKLVAGPSLFGPVPKGTIQASASARGLSALTVVQGMNAFCVSIYTGPPPPPDQPPIPATTFDRFGLGDPSSLAQISANPGYIYAGDFGPGGLFYGLNAGTNQLVRIDTTTGSVTVVGASFPLSGETWTGLTYDPTAATMYASSTNGSRSTLYTVNLASGAIGLVGQITNGPGVISIACNNEGTMYGVEIIADVLIRIDQGSGAGTIIGSLGYSTAYAQDADFDPATGILYLATWNTSLGRAELRTADLNTGQTTLVGPFPSLQEVTALGISGASGSTWLSAHPPVGAIGIGDSVLMTAVFDASIPAIYESPGDYLGRLQFTASNSLLEDTLDVPVRMSVHPPAGARLRVLPDALNFGDIQKGQASTLPVLVRNIGAATLNVTNMVSTNAAFTLSPTSFSLNLLDTQRVNITFTAPNAEGTTSAQVNFTSNDPSAPPIALAGRSIDGKWVQQSSGTSSALFSISMVTDKVAWAGGDNGVAVRTTDGGVTWLGTQQLPGPIDNIFALSQTYAIASVNPTWGDDARLYRTLDGGLNWYQVYYAAYPGAHMNASQMFNSTNGHAVCDPGSGIWFLLKSTNAGSSWSMFSYLPQAGIERGWRNAATWLNAQTGWIGTNNFRVYATTDAGATWGASPTPFSTTYGVSFVSGGLGMIGGSFGQTCLSTNAGASWVSKAAAGNGANVLLAGVQVPDPHWWAASGLKIYRTNDLGSSWQLEYSASADLHHIAAKYFPSAGKVVGYAVGSLGQILRYEAAMPTKTIGYNVLERWNLVSVPLSLADYTKTLVFPTATTDAFAYNAGYSASATLEKGRGYWVKFSAAQPVSFTGVEESTDTVAVAAGWNLVGSLGASMPVASIGSIPGGIVTGSFFRYDGSYHPSATIEPGRGYWVKVSQAGRLVFTTGGTIASANRIRIEESGEVPPPPPDREELAGAALPDRFALRQNYPNPFNPATRVAYELPVDSKVRCVIYNVMGQTVAMLVDGVESAGYKSVEWNASTAASGVYFYKLEATSVADPGTTFTEVKKMLLLR